MNGPSDTQSVKPAAPSSGQTVKPSAIRAGGGKRFNDWRCLKKTSSPAWGEAIGKLAAEIKVRHYSRKATVH